MWCSISIANENVHKEKQFQHTSLTYLFIATEGEKEKRVAETKIAHWGWNAREIAKNRRILWAPKCRLLTQSTKQRRRQADYLRRNNHFPSVVCSLHAILTNFFVWVMYPLEIAIKSGQTNLFFEKIGKICYSFLRSFDRRSNPFEFFSIFL